MDTVYYISGNSHESREHKEPEVVVSKAEVLHHSDHVITGSTTSSNVNNWDEKQVVDWLVENNLSNLKDW